MELNKKATTMITNSAEMAAWFAKKVMFMNLSWGRAAGEAEKKFRQSWLPRDGG